MLLFTKKKHLERQKLFCIIIIFNMMESNDDKANDRKIIRNFAKEDVDIVESVTIGKSNKKDNRVLKIILPDPNIVAKIVCSKKDSMMGKKVHVSADLSISQRNQYNKLKDIIHTRHNNGESDITFRHVNGMPKIVKKN